MKSEDRELVRSAKALLDRARAEEPRYAAGHCPISTRDFSRLLLRLRCRRVLVRMAPDSPPEVRAATLPPIGGFRWIGVRADLDDLERTFGERHELAHILNGDAEEFISLADRGFMTWAERKADLFAAADLFPTQLLQSFRRAGMTWKGIVVEVRGAIVRDYGSRWPQERVRDRARLRVGLYREFGI